MVSCATCRLLHQFGNVFSVYNVWRSFTNFLNILPFQCEISTHFPLKTHPKRHFHPKTVWGAQTKPSLQKLHVKRISSLDRCFLQTETSHLALKCPPDNTSPLKNRLLLSRTSTVTTLLLFKTDSWQVPFSSEPAQMQKYHDEKLDAKGKQTKRKWMPLR